MPEETHAFVNINNNNNKLLKAMKALNQI